MNQCIKDFVERVSAELAGLLGQDEAVLSGRKAADAFAEEVMREASRRGVESFYNARGEELSKALREGGYRVERAPRVRFFVAQGSIRVRSPYLRRDGDRKGIRPLRDVYGVHGGRCSDRVLRWATDFGLDRSFARAAEAMMEHHGLKVPSTSVRHRTLSVATDLETWLDERLADAPGAADNALDEVFVQADGCMIPVVEWVSAGCLGRTGVPRDQKLPKREWIETRTALARAKGQVEPQFVCRVGSYDELTERMEGLVNRLGGDLDTHVVGIGDGGNGLMEALERRFPEFSYVLDQGHLKSHLYCAADALGVEPTTWVETAMKTLASGGVETLRQELEAPAREERQRNQGTGTKNTLANLRDYLERFADCVRYDDYRKKEWPVGSGEIEAAHRYVPQARLKKPGAWWLREHVNPMCQARAVRANHEWNDYWDQRAAA